jgi:hypothetical protein
VHLGLGEVPTSATSTPHLHRLSRLHGLTSLGATIHVKVHLMMHVVGGCGVVHGLLDVSSTTTHLHIVPAVWRADNHARLALGVGMGVGGEISSITYYLVVVAELVVAEFS